MKIKIYAANRRFTAENGGFRYLQILAMVKKYYFFVMKNKSFIQNLVVLTLKLAAIQLF